MIIAKNVQVFKNSYTGHMEELLHQYGYLAVFLLTSLDHSGTPLGIILSIGLVTTGELELIPTLLIATAGGIAGDIVLYTLGWVGGNKMVEFFKARGPKTKEGIEKASKFLKEYGLVFLVWGRFIAFVGRYMSLVYGAIRFRPLASLACISLGSILMTLGSGIPLYLIGEKFNEITANKNFTLILSATLIVLQILASAAWAKWKGLKGEVLN